jgi:hypothetical protein
MKPFWANMDSEQPAKSINNVIFNIDDEGTAMVRHLHYILQDRSLKI